MSPLHVRAYLDAADRALDTALALGPRPPTERHVIEYVKSQVLEFIRNADFQGGGAVKKLDDGYATFSEVTSTYLLHSLSEGFSVPWPGRYRVALEAYAYQADTPVTLTVYRGLRAGVAVSLDELIGSFDLVGKTPRTVEVTPFLRPGDAISPALADADVPPGDHPGLYFQPDKYVRDYQGEGVALKSMTIEGPLLDAWPPASTRQLLPGVEFDAEGQIRLTQDPYEHVVDVVAAFAPRAFRRPLEDGELEAYASLARPLLADGRPFLEAVRVPLRAILSAPPFLYHGGEAGEMDDFGLATRLAYFLWRSTPDDALLEMAGAGRLSDPDLLARQVDRMLDDDRTARFVRDFAGQAFRLYELKATSPDAGLYPEYDDRLGQAMARETELFLAELIAGNHGAGKPDRRRLHVREPPPGGALRHRGHRGAAHAPGGAAAGQPARRSADAGERAEGDGERDDDLAGAARQLRAGEPARAAGGAAPGRGGGSGAGHARDDDHPGAVGRAPVEPGLRKLPQGDRSARFRAGIVRPDRRLPDALPGHRRRDGVRRFRRTRTLHPGAPGGCQRRHAGRRRLRGHPRLQAADAAARPRAGGPQPEHAVAGLRDRRGDRVRGSRRGGRHRGAAARRRVSYTDHDSRGRAERPSSGADEHESRPDLSTVVRSCAPRVWRWRCRCSNRCRRSSRAPVRPGLPGGW